MSESAIPGSPPLSSLLKMMTWEDVEDKTGRIWEFRTKDNPYNGVEDLTHYRMLEKTARQLFGTSEDPLMRVRTMEYAQYELERLQGEHYRRRKYATSGLLFWMYNDCWPASGWSMIDYYGFPKAGYFGAKKAFRPLMISVEDRKQEIGIWLVNDTRVRSQGSIELRSARTDGTELYIGRIEAELPANAAFLAAVWNKAELGLSREARDVVVQASWYPNERVGLQEGMDEDRTVYFEVMPKDLQLHPASLQVICHPKDARSGVLEIITDVYARVVTIEDELLVEDNYFDLMPGETRLVPYKTKPGYSWRGMSAVSCWNGRQEQA
ncbi:glycoside hydrolase family 2 protein [Cohnella silvisoli]|uniref:Beta-mannosidase n=1 Tax=Cohnella silvisoli TaxID=2873699 RepID=A0ABV1KXQ9_9BACL|nr:glycoside hydrolase family 2 protein [Cohnella silvisoli]MCD9024015.1 hypothetical protein [Cohnella silvisoli]